MSKKNKPENKISDAVNISLEPEKSFLSVFDLSPAEKLQLVEDLWDDLATSHEAIPIHDWQKKELDRREANLSRYPAAGLTWDEVKRRVRSRYGR